MDTVKTFASPLRIFHTSQELEGLDEQVNRFAKENNIARINIGLSFFTQDLSPIPWTWKQIWQSARM